MSEWMRPKEAAEYCNVSERLLRNWLQGGLKHVRKKGVVLIRKQYLDEFLECHIVDSATES